MQVLISSIRLTIHIIGWEFLFKKQSNNKLCFYYYIDNLNLFYCTKIKCDLLFYNMTNYHKIWSNIPQEFPAQRCKKNPK